MSLKSMKLLDQVVLYCPKYLFQSFRGQLGWGKDVIVLSPFIIFPTLKGRTVRITL